MENERESIGKCRLIGLTGGIGAGKSVVSRVLRLHGEKVYDCDVEARRLMEGDETLRRALCAICGAGIYKEDGELDRPLLGKLIFSDTDLRQKVNRLVHGAVLEDLRKVWGKNGEEGRERMFVESAILYSSGIGKMTDEVWIVEAVEEIRVRRVMQRSGLSREQILARISAQQRELSMAETDQPVRYIRNEPGVPLLPQID